MTESAARSRPVNIAVIGGGNVTRDFIGPAFASVPEANLVCIADVKRKDEIAAREYLTPGVTYCQVDGSSISRLPLDRVDAVIVASTHDNHTSNLGEVLAAGKAAAVEKPCAPDDKGLDAIPPLLAAHPDQVVDFWSYYTKVKGLPWRTLLPDENPMRIRPGGWHDRSGFLLPEVNPILPHVLDSIGDFERMTITCLEGGSQFDIIGRESVVDKRNLGGMMRDLGDHVFTYAILLGDRVGNMTLDRVRAGKSIEALEHFRNVPGNSDRTLADMEETFAQGSMTSENGFPIEWTLGKYTGKVNAAGDLNSWGVQVVGKHGYVYLNLKSSGPGSRTMTVDSPAFKGQITVGATDKPKYHIMLSEFVRMVQNPSEFAGGKEFGYVNDTLRLVYSIKSEIDRQGDMFTYSGGVIPEEPGFARIRDLADSYRGSS